MQRSLTLVIVDVVIVSKTKNLIAKQESNVPSISQRNIRTHMLCGSVLLSARGDTQLHSQIYAGANVLTMSAI